MTEKQSPITSDIPITKIITHPGGAHRDDFLAACFAASLNNQIERREPTPEELADPSVVVLDVGKQHNAQLNNFDHHHDGTLPCSLTLFAQKFGLHETLLETAPWYEAIDFRDRNGPAKLADKFGVPQENMAALDDPVMGAMLQQFSSFKGNVSEEFVQHVMKPIGAIIMQKALTHKTQLAELAECEQRDISGLKVLFGKPVSIEASKDFCAKNQIDVVVNAVANRAKPSELQYNITRTTPDESKIDFRLYGDAFPGEALFVHNSGFMMAAHSQDQALEAIAYSAERARDTDGKSWAQFVEGGHNRKSGAGIAGDKDTK